MNSLDVVWRSYQITVDAMKVTRRATEREAASPLLSNTALGAMPASVASQLLVAVSNDIDNLYVLALWSVFERDLRSHLEAEGTKPLDTSDSLFHQHLAATLRPAMEYWRNEDVLDLFKSVAGPELIGRAKQIKHYRDWVAHRNPKRPQPTNISPAAAYTTLSAIFDSLPVAPDLNNESKDPN